MSDSRPCTCAPDERPYPCQHQYALGLCRKAEIRSLRIELDRCIAQIADLTKIRLEDELVHGNVMGRIAVALFGEQNNRTDEECVALAAEIGYELSGAKQRAERAEADLAAARADAERYRWLRDTRRIALGPIVGQRPAMGESGCRYVIAHGSIARVAHDIETLDAAIDAALAGEKR